jgi:hypothetical protein
MTENTLITLKDYFGVTAQEMMTFWRTLTDEEKDYFKSAELV